LRSLPISACRRASFAGGSVGRRACRQQQQVVNLYRRRIHVLRTLHSSDVGQRQVAQNSAGFRTERVVASDSLVLVTVISIVIVNILIIVILIIIIIIIVIVTKSVVVLVIFVVVIIIVIVAVVKVVRGEPEEQPGRRTRRNSAQRRSRRHGRSRSRRRVEAVLVVAVEKLRLHNVAPFGPRLQAFRVHASKVLHHVVDGHAAHGAL
jgi:ABC-type multidrug transport system fused ATPase/permease subunit